LNHTRVRPCLSFTRCRSPVQLHFSYKVPNHRV